MKHNFLKKVSAASIVAVTCMTLSNATLDYVHAASTTYDFTPFSDMTYNHIDTKKFYKTIKEMNTLLKKKDNFVKLKTKYDYIYNTYLKLTLESNQANLYNTLNVNSSYYKKEVQYCTTTLPKLQNELVSITKKILSSSYASKFKKQYGKDFINSIVNQDTPSKKQQKLLDKEQQLVLEYNEESIKTYTTEINGKSYSYDDLAASTTLSEEERAQGILDIYEKENKALGTLYVDLVKTRQDIAKSYHYSDYSEYCYKEMYDRDYTVSDSQTFCDEVKKTVAPIYEELYSKIDMPALRDFNKNYNQLDSKKIFDMVTPYFSKISPSLEEAYKVMRKNSLYNIDFDSSKMNGGLTTFLLKYNEPFICIQPNFLFTDMSTFVHEFGHFHSSIVNIKEAAFSNNLDLAEIHSQGLELLYTNFYGDIFGGTSYKEAQKFVVFNTVSSIIYGGIYDEFQRRVYKLKNPTLDQINQTFADVYKEYLPSTATDPLAKYEWTGVLHNFVAPLYYISYATAAAPALEIWGKSLTNFDDACTTYMNVVKCGEKDTYKKTLVNCGLKSPFSSGYFTELTTSLKNYFN